MELSRLFLITTILSSIFLFLLLITSVGFSCDDYILELKYDTTKLSDYILSGNFFFEPLTVFSTLTFTFDGAIHEIYPKSSFLNFFNELNYSHFLSLAILTAVIVYPFDAYTSFTIMESFIITSSVVGVIKFIIGRARPYIGDDPYSFKPFNFSEDYQSFPSGHSALSWAIFTPVGLRFGDIWYTIPIVLSVQRLWSNNHWESDIIFGASLGYNFAKLFYKARRE